MRMGKIEKNIYFLASTNKTNIMLMSTTIHFEKRMEKLVVVIKGGHAERK